MEAAACGLILRTKVSKETKVSDTMVLLRLLNYQKALTGGYHRLCYWQNPQPAVRFQDILFSLGTLQTPAVVLI